METPHVPRRTQRVETRGLEKKCKGDCKDLEEAKKEIARLNEVVRLLEAKLERANEDLRLSQETQLGSQLRFEFNFSIIEFHLYFFKSIECC